jgi:hypothetical protein
MVIIVKHGSRTTNSFSSQEAQNFRRVHQLAMNEYTTTFQYRLQKVFQSKGTTNANYKFTKSLRNVVKQMSTLHHWSISHGREKKDP